MSATILYFVFNLPRVYVCGQRFFVYNNDTNLNFIAFCPVIRVKISQFNQFLCLLFETQFDPLIFTFFLYFEPVHPWSNQGQQAQPCCFSLNVVSIRVGNNARVYKKRSTAEKYMLNLTISNSLCYSQFSVFFCVCFCVSFNQQQLRNIILNIWLCIVLVISRGLPFLSYMFVYVFLSYFSLRL